jgi:protein MBA1
MYDAKGNALHKPANGLPPQWDIDANKPEPWRVPAERRRVTEYLVLEKRMWTQNPWQFREQMW